MTEETKRDAINEYVESLNPDENTMAEVITYLVFRMKAKAAMREAVELMNYHKEMP